MFVNMGQIFIYLKSNGVILLNVILLVIMRIIFNNSKVVFWFCGAISLQQNGKF